MAEVYPLGFCKEVDGEVKRISVVAQVDESNERGVVINDTTGKCRVIGVPTNLSGLIEVWGTTNRNREIESKGFTTFTDVNFEFDSHIQITEYMRKFKDLS